MAQEQSQKGSTGAQGRRGYRKGVILLEGSINFSSTPSDIYSIEWPNLYLILKMSIRELIYRSTCVRGWSRYWCWSDEGESRSSNNFGNGRGYWRQSLDFSKTCGITVGTRFSKPQTLMKNKLRSRISVQVDGGLRTGAM